jgi:cobalt-zinc-cadmium efflux system membrane fusion protein
MNMSGPSSRSHSPVVVLVVLALIATLMWFGHRRGWRIDSPARAGAAAEDWCEEHRVPESRCVQCHPELAAELTGRPAAEHADHAQEAGAWCEEHGLPEASCTICHPEIGTRASTPPARELTAAATRPAPDPRLCQSHLLVVQLASEETLRKTGIVLEAAEEKPVTRFVAAPGRIEHDQSRLARLSARAGGIVFRVDKREGDPVAEGELLALVEAADVGKAKAELLEARTVLELRRKTLARIRPASDAGTATRAELEETVAAEREAALRLFNAEQALENLGLAVPGDLAHEDALATLRYLGIPDDAVARLRAETRTANLLPVKAPFAGVLLRRERGQGEAIAAAEPFLTVASLATMWVELHVVPADAARVAPGQPVTFRPDADAEGAVTGKVLSVAAEVDRTTGMVGVRAEIEPGGRRLTAGSFGRGRIAVRASALAVTVPSAAVHWEGCCHVVFVRTGHLLFQTRKVVPGLRDSGLTEIRSGVLAGEVVVTTGSFALNSEIQKSRLGAGCADH